MSIPMTVFKPKQKPEPKVHMTPLTASSQAHDPNNLHQ